MKLIEDNRLFNEIYGPNSHIQLINKSKEFLEIMIQNNKLSETELSIIWEATQKGDLEGKLTILNIFKEIIGSFKENHLNYNYCPLKTFISSCPKFFLRNDHIGKYKSSKKYCMTLRCTLVYSSLNQSIFSDRVF